MENLHYEDRLRRLELMSLETRRVCDLIKVFKFINGDYANGADIFSEYDKGNSTGHSKKLYKRRSRLDIRKFVFGYKVTDKWNNLPQCCIKCTTSNNFKSHIHKVLEPETQVKSYNLDSERYMAKAVSVIIDGFGECVLQDMLLTCADRQWVKPNNGRRAVIFLLFLQWRNSAATLNHSYKTRVRLYMPTYTTRLT